MNNFSPDNLKVLLPQVKDIALEAGDLIQNNLWARDKGERKSDGSYFTPADVMSEELILNALRHLTPDIPLISEELVEREGIPAHEGTFWCVDPLDGTSPFIEGSEEYYVNIGLVVNRTPVLGVFHSPAQGWVCGGAGDHAFYQATRSSAPEVFTPLKAFDPTAPLTVAISPRDKKNPEIEEILSRYSVKKRLYLNGMAKAIELLRGEADLTLRFVKCSEWDVACWHAVLNTLGGELRTIAGAPMVYGSSNMRVAPFIATGALKRLV